MEFLKKLFHKTNNDLEEALKKAAYDNKQIVNFSQLLLSSDIYIIGTTKKEVTGRVALVAGDLIEVYHTVVDGEEAVPVFTSLAQLEGYTKTKVNYVKLNCRNLFEILMGKMNVIINPNTQFAYIYSKEELVHLLSGGLCKHDEITFDGETQIQIGQPAAYPTQMVNRIISEFSKYNEIRNVYLAWILVPNSGEPPHYIFGIECISRYKEFSQMVGNISRSFLEKDQFIDIVQIGDNTISEYMRTTEPLYKG